MATTRVSTRDHEAFATAHMPDLGHDVKEFRAFHWKLQGWKKLERKLTSPEFDCGGHKWRILLFPFGNFNTPPTDVVSVYLDHVNPNTQDGWYACAQFALVISNPHDPTIYTVSHTHHRFTPKECDWGFTRFSEPRKLNQPQSGHNRPTIERGSTVISVYVRVLEDPTGVLWHDFVSYDSKKATGCVGLKNLGATGYMNAVLQCLFHIHYFRKAVYKITTENKQPTKSIPLALQRVFYLLQTSDHLVDTTELTKAFCWGPVDLLVPHDVQEFNRVLWHKLESEMKGTRAEGTIAKLFTGKMKSLIKCVDVDYESSSVEEFNDIRLKVKGMETLYDSFRDYVAVKILNGERGYQTGEFGLQDARAAVTFQSFPPVLHLLLKRYEYDIRHDAMVKINDRFEFPFEIDLDEFLDETADRTEPWKYKLHSVLVHSGGAHGGHNFALIKPDRYTQWLKFDDDRVIPVSDREVLEGNYGGVPLDGTVPRARWDQSMAIERSTNANVVVYVRKSTIGEVMGPFTEEDTPPHLGRGLSEERFQKEAKEKKRGEKNLFLTVKIVTDETFSRHEGFDLAAFDNAFKSKVAQYVNYPESQIRLWVLVKRQNKTTRPDTYIPESGYSLTVEEIHNNMAKRQHGLWLYLDILPDPSQNRLNNTEMAMVFLKHFNATRQSLFGIGKVYVPRASKLKDLFPVINERMKWESGTRLKLYEEINPGMIEPMKPGYTFAQSEIRDGDIICFQVDISDQEARDLGSRGLHSNPKQFYDSLGNQGMKTGGREEPPV